MKEHFLTRLKVISGPNKGIRDVHIKNGVFESITPTDTISPPEGAEILDCEGCIALPGPIDNHVHFREPGPVAYKEGWESGSLSALRGGITGVIEVQNSPPFCTNASALIAKRDFVSKKSLVDFGFYANVLATNLDTLSECAPLCAGFKLFLGHSTGDIGVSDKSVWEKAAEIAAEKGLPIAVHAEDPDFFPKAKTTDHDANRPCVSEVESVKAAIRLARDTKAHIHLFHLSCAESVVEVVKAKNKGLPVSAAVCPHHLVLTNEDAKHSPSFLKVNPPLRANRHVEALRKALANGTIDVLQSDHAPHLFDEKSKSFEQAPAGLPGVEHLIPWAIEFYHRGFVSLERLEELLCTNPRRIAKLDLTSLETGKIAHFSVISLDGKVSVSAKICASKSAWTPYEGMTLRGAARYVYLHGVPTIGCGFQHDFFGRFLASKM